MSRLMKRNRSKAFLLIVAVFFFALIPLTFDLFTAHHFSGLARAQGEPDNAVPPGTVDIIEDIRLTRHNLSPGGYGDVKLDPTAPPGPSVTTEVCIFCHTPHGSNLTSSGDPPVDMQAPLWNRNLSYPDNTGYVLYDQTWSYSFEGQIEAPGTKPTGYSRLCLSCHDGVIALGAVINKPGSGGFRGFSPVDKDEGLTPIVNTNDDTEEKMPPGSTGFDPGIITGAFSGDTRLLGTNLQNDHPISFVFDSELATSIDTELVDPGPPPGGLNDVTALAPGGGFRTGAKRFPGNDPSIANQVQCTSCHNPHGITYPKFLRAPRFQDAEEEGFLPCSPNCPAGDLAPPGQIICLYCHSKPGWAGSTHDRARSIRAAYPDADNPATQHPENYDFDGSHTVGQVACRNCHDPHTAQGAKRLHREGVTAFGGSSSIENTCYLCHSPNESAVSPITTFLPAGDKTSSSNHRFCDDTPDHLPNFCAKTSPFRFAPDIWTQFNKDSGVCLGGGGTGSAMCLQLTTLQASHEPVFLFRSQEGVQLASEGLTLRPIDNEEFPGNTTKDERHVECVDCHNPHQINSPHFASVAYNGADAPNEKGGRFKGMKGIGIDITGTRPIVVGRFGMSDIDIDGKSANRDPYVYEICFRCHGNSYENIFRQDRNPDDIVTMTVPAGFATYTSIVFSPRTDPQLPGPDADPAMSFKGFSNKWKEFNPKTPDIDQAKMISIDLARFGQAIPSHTGQSENPAFHPVVRPGRNGSEQLCNQLEDAFGLNCGTGQAGATLALSNLTIQCTDCHNNDYYDAWKTGVLDSSLLGPLTESNLRLTDRFPADLVGRAVSDPTNYDTLRVKEPIGPHGSTHSRLLRANYNTDILDSTRCFAQNNPPGCSKGDGYGSTGSASHGIAGGGVGIDSDHFENFLLCFQCHNRKAFDPVEAFNQGTDDQDRGLTRFFGTDTTLTTGQVDSWWEGNLHMYHLRWTGAMCHECHYNIHSNVEALNTIYGDGRGGQLPPDNVDGMTDGVIGTHLINFAPTVEGTTGIKPIWFYDGQAFRCYLRCHNEVMDSCAYQAPNSGTPNARWCAGGRNPGTAG